MKTNTKKSFKKSFISILMVFIMAVSLAGCSSGEQKPQGTYKCSWINGTITVSGTSVALKNVWVGPGAGSVTCQASVTDWGKYGTGDYYWWATITYKTNYSGY